MKLQFLPSRRICVSTAVVPWIALAMFRAAAVAQPASTGGSSNFLPILHCPGPALISVESLPPRPDFALASGNFAIVAVFDASVTPAQRVVIQHAVNEWDAILQSRGVNPASYTVSFSYGTLGGRIGSTGVSIALTGELISANTAFELNVDWFVDPTPADDSEFSSATPPTGVDLLTVARHELGHALGWIASNRVTNSIGNDVFDGSRLNIGMSAGDAQHSNPAVHADDLMQPSLGASVRRPIRLYPNGALIARAYQQQIPMLFIDPAYGGVQAGTAWQPWRTLPVASAQSPELPLLLAPATHLVSRGQTFLTPHRWEAARGGASVIAP